MNFQPGTSIGRYHLLEAAGAGGMAIVYKAFDTHLERNVAIKFIRTEALPRASMEQILKRFAQEAKALASLSHTNIVKVIDYGEFEGTPFLVLEYLQGGTLKDRLGQPMPYREASALLRPVARALAYAHQRSMVHRDVKPANILFDEAGQPLLTDFGVVKILESAGGTNLTGTGVGIGTPEYMAPEQALSESVDGRADIYALGVVLFELVTGRKPYTAETPMGLVLKHINDPLPPPRQFMPDLPEVVEQVIVKALAKKPADRYPDMNAFDSALARLEALPVVVPPAEGDLAKTLIDSDQTLYEPKPGYTGAHPVRSQPATAAPRSRGSQSQASQSRPGTAGSAAAGRARRAAPGESRTAGGFPLQGDPALDTGASPGGWLARLPRWAAFAVVPAVLLACLICVGLPVLWNAVRTPTPAAALATQVSTQAGATVIVSLPTVTPSPTPNQDLPTAEFPKTSTPDRAATQAESAARQAGTQSAAQTQAAASLPSPTAGPSVTNFRMCDRRCDDPASRTVIGYTGGATQAYFEWDYANFPTGVRYERVWSMDGQEWIHYTCTWPGPSQGTFQVGLFEPQGLKSGTWLITITIDGQPVWAQEVPVVGSWDYWAPASPVTGSCGGLR